MNKDLKQQLDKLGIKSAKLSSGTFRLKAKRKKPKPKEDVQQLDTEIQHLEKELDNLKN